MNQQTALQILGLQFDATPEQAKKAVVLASHQGDADFDQVEIAFVYLVLIGTQKPDPSSPFLRLANRQ